MFNDKTYVSPYLFQVPMMCNPPISLECRNKNGDNTSSENEMEEIILPGNGTLKGDLSPMTGDVPYRDTNPEAVTLVISSGENDYNDATQKKTNDATPNKTNDVSPNKKKDNGGADLIVDAPSSDSVSNSVDFNLSHNVTHKSNNCNGHSKSTKITM